MFKKVLLAALVVLTIMWGGGYDFGKFKDEVLETSDGNAATLTGRGGPDNWGG